MFPFLLLWLALIPAVQPQVKTTAPASQHPQSSIQVNESIREQVEQLQEQAGQGGNERSVFNHQLVRFYGSTGYHPVWLQPQSMARLIELIRQSEDDGLTPSDYHLEEIRHFYSTPPDTPFLKARADILLTDAFIMLAAHTRYGKVDPEKLDPNWNLPDSPGRTLLEQRIKTAILSDTFAELLGELRPSNPKYGMLRAGLARYREIAKSGGWPSVPAGQSIEKEGARDPRIPLIRRRLTIEGDFVPSKVSDTSRVYSKALREAVIKFQKRHGLNADGGIGRETLAEMNIPVEQRIDQIRINLERYRWFINDLGPDYVLVNIASFTIQVVEDSKYQWRSRVIVGQPYRKTPVFKADMQYIILNPQWVVPPSILEKDALPAIRKDVSYLSKKKLSVVDRNGAVVDPSTVKWSQYTAGNFPYRLRQASGEGGSLGRIKFMFPNKHVVYLHDTPTKNLFNETQRTFSSGCIRVEHPLDLATLVLRDSVRWSKQNIQQAINTGKTQTIQLPKRIPVFLLYLTAMGDSDDIWFRKDIYQRDAELLQALKKPFPYKNVPNTPF